jgi:outer membrane receptor for ferrienterochelin and colicins
LVLKPLGLACAVVLAIGAMPQPATAQQERELGEVKVQGPRTPSAVRPTLQDEIVKTESFTRRDIEQSNAASVLEAIDKNPGISVQVECSICNVRNITLNNLPGRYTTLLLDGIPLFSSVSSAYGLDMVGINGIERIDVARGAGVSLIAPEALSGTVNLVTRRPAAREATGQLQGGEFGYRRADAFLGQPFAGGAVTGSFNFNESDAVDQNGNRVSEYTGYRRMLGGIGLFLDDVGGFTVRGRVDAITEDRGGGALGRDFDAIKASRTGNPFDWSAGKGGSPDPRGWVLPDASLATGGEIALPDGRLLVPYDSGRGGFSEIIFTDRYQGYLIGERRLGEGRLRIAGGYANHEQDSFYEGDTYKARQDQQYLEASYQRPLGATLVTAGLSYRYEDLTSRGVLADGTRNDGLDDYVYKTPGFFIQGYRAFLGDRAEANASLRYDDNNVFGGIWTPRVNVLYRHTHEWSSRLAAGTGYRFPTSFFELDHGILATTRVQREIDKPEKSQNASYALAYASDRLSGVASVNWTRIRNAALLDPDACLDAGGGLTPSGDPTCTTPVTLFKAAQEPVTVRGADLVLTYRATTALDLTFGAEVYRYTFNPEQLFPAGSFVSPLTFARPEQRLIFRADYEAHGWLIFARATWTGAQDLAKFYDYAHTQRYNLDGTPKRGKSPSFWTVDLRAAYKFGKHLSAVAGVNNLFDYRQVDTEDYLWVDAAGSPDVTHIWGPNLGRQIYAGIKAEL